MANAQQVDAYQQKKNATLEKQDSGTAEADFEVAEPMRITNSGDPTDERPGVEEKKPVIEKHIANVDEDGSGGTKEHIKEKVKKHLPGHQSSGAASDTQEEAPINYSREDSGSLGAEVSGNMQGSLSPSSETPSKMPRLERHISSIPEKDDDADGEEEEGMSGKLRRTISHIAQKD